jgi:hypothetical protein
MSADRAVGPAGDVYVTGHTDGALAVALIGTQDGYVRAYNMGGDYRWTRHIGATGQASQANSVAVDSGANVDVVGSTNGTLTACLPADCTHQGAAGVADGFARKLSRGRVRAPGAASRIPPRLGQNHVSGPPAPGPERTVRLVIAG